ncbi:MAG: hypothetical protein CSA35_05125 [Dethiosulfovibrio peptidovorans]|nr:MAG: hypothetical protein CSA35_05125 [Dethiosulfovibrio peptidovorans]
MRFLRTLWLVVLLLSVFNAGQAVAVSSLRASNVDISRDDLIYILSKRMGSDRTIAALALDDLSPSQRRSFLTYVGDVVILSEAARLKGLAFNEDVLRQTRWDTVNTLAKAYVDRLALGWDTHTPALLRFYESNTQKYLAPKRVRALVRLCADRDEAILYRGREKGLKPRWYSFEDTPVPLQKAFFQELRMGDIPPVILPDGSVLVVRVLEYQGQQVLPFEFVQDRVRDALQASYLAHELSRLREKITVKFK